MKTCQFCKYNRACGDSERTAPCDGRYAPEVGDIIKVKGHELKLISIENANFDGDDDEWYIEYHSQYGYGNWKQSVDGGELIKR